MLIKEMMREAVIIDMNATLEEVIAKMASDKVNSLLVVNTEGELVGSVDVVTLIKTIVPEYIGNRDKSIAGFTTDEMFSDYINDNKSKKVKYFMLDAPKTIKESSSALEAAIKTTEGRQSRIPVINEENQPVGVVTRQGIKKFLAIQLDITVD